MPHLLQEVPVLYFLHGLFEDETRWSSRGGTDQIMDRMIADGKIGEFIVAIPNGATSFYVNTRDGKEKWEGHDPHGIHSIDRVDFRVNASRTPAASAV